MPNTEAHVTLALDTTTRAGSVAVMRGDRTLALVAGDPTRTHGERLPLDVAAALGRAGVELAAITLYSVAVGPGSFTGLRVGIAAVQGLALATSRRVVPIPTLDALAACDEARSDDAGQVGVWMDGQRGQVFAAIYHGTRQVTRAAALPPHALIERWNMEPGATGHPAVVIGDGAVRYADLIATAWPDARIVAPPALAPVIGRLAGERADQAVAPHGIVPIYVRPPDAELARERARRGADRTGSP
jgi:tRNA threonylcarbamoyladenosine biosynthesis protein TsaB